LAGIGFADPDGLTEANSLSQMVIADLRFSSNNMPVIPNYEMEAVLSPGNVCILLPLASSTTKYEGFEQAYRFSCGVPASSGTPPQNPTTAYLQNLIDKYGPAELCSDPSANSHPVQISQTLWSTRVRTHSAVADRFFTRFNHENPAKCTSDAQNGGIILLVGDSAHIHSPAAGQGMNLGLRDATFLGPTIATHINQPQSSAADAILQEYASVRRSMAFAVVRLTKRALNGMSGPTVSKWFWWFPLWTIRRALFRILGKIQFVRSTMAWRLSGLGTR
jgi:hypothetical protein